MTDKEVIDFIVAKCGDSVTKAAQRIGLANRQTLIHWRNRRVSPQERGRVYSVANRLGAKLPMSWLLKIPPTKDEGQTNGRESKAAPKTKGSQATRRRARSVAESRP
jgi:hypothetical protein